MISPIYAAISMIIIGYLAVQVVKVRRKHKISIGDAQNKELIKTQAAHSNAIENIPMTLILLFALELNGGHIWLIHLCGVVLISSRIFHAKAMLTHKLKLRTLAMQTTLFILIALSLLNILYLPYDKFFG